MLSCQESNAVFDRFSISSSLCQLSLLLAHWRPFKVVVIVVVVVVVVVFSDLLQKSLFFSTAVTTTNISSEIEIVQKSCDSNEVPTSAEYLIRYFCLHYSVATYKGGFSMPVSVSYIS